ncbi:MAG: alpha/beta hydrolase, partial [Brevundimonas sp.]
RHEVIMETDDLRAQFLDEFDAMAEYVAPQEGATTVAPEPEAVSA